MSEENTYYVHTEDWAMIEITPGENREQVQRAFNDPGRAEENAHLRLTHPITERNLSLDMLDALFGPLLARADQLLTGYTTELEPVPDGFAYYDDDLGALYGTHQNGSIKTLYYDNQACNCGIDFSAVMATITTFAQQHRLILVDWFLDLLVDFSQADAFPHYIEEE